MPSLPSLIQINNPYFHYLVFIFLLWILAMIFLSIVQNIEISPLRILSIFHIKKSFLTRFLVSEMNIHFKNLDAAPLDDEIMLQNLASTINLNTQS